MQTLREYWWLFIIIILSLFLGWFVPDRYSVHITNIQDEGRRMCVNDVLSSVVSKGFAEIMFVEKEGEEPLKIILAPVTPQNGETER